ncbi:MAG: ankyrin repeat domain-containing protein [Cyanobacteriota bacterium]
MGSQMYSYSGRCIEHNVQEEIINCFRKLGELVLPYEEKMGLSKPYIFYDNVLIKGKKLFNFSIFDRRSYYEKLGEIKEDIYLYGVSFILLDYRDLYAENRFDLIFLRSKNPEFDGLIVSFEDEANCKLYTNSLIYKSKYYIHKPVFRFRHYFLDWFGKVFSWINEFYSFKIDFEGYIDKKTNSKKEVVFEELTQELIKEFKYHYSKFFWHSIFSLDKEFFKKYIDKLDISKIDCEYLFFDVVSGADSFFLSCLLEKDIDVNFKFYNKESLLMLGARNMFYSNIEIVDLLIKKGADINYKGLFGLSATKIASIKGYDNIVDLLIENGANPEDKNFSLLDKFLYYIFNDYSYEKILEKILKEGFDINSTDSYGNTVIILCVDDCDIFGEQLFHFLISNNANIHKKNNQGESALSIAEKNKNQDMVDLLLRWEKSYQSDLMNNS